MMAPRGKRNRFMRENAKVIFGVPILILAISLTAMVDNVAWAQLVNVTCGAYDQRPCTLADEGWMEGGLRPDGCDRGLKSEWVGYCAKRASWWPYPCIEFQYAWNCENDTRWQDWADTVQTWWSYGALMEQRKLARNEPINWVMHLAGHNAFNNYADGYILFPNQSYSITDQLRMGVRVVMLDVHNLISGLKLSHALDNHVGAALTDRHFVYGLKEIRDWLNQNPDEVIIIEIEDYLDGAILFPETWYVEDLEEQLGKWILRKNEKPSGRWPTLEEMRALQRNVIVLSQDFHHSDLLFDGGWSTDKNPKPYKFDLGSSNAKDFTCSEAFRNPGDKFSEVYEDSLVGEVYDEYEYNGPETVGLFCSSNIPPGDCPWVYLKDVVSCNIGIIGLDDLITGIRSMDLIWSWEKNEWGWTQQNKAAVQSNASGRFVAVDPQEVHPFACGRKRDGDPLLWLDGGPETLWKITQRVGTWEEGAEACCEEFGSEKLVFGVPVNGLQNTQLYDLARGKGEDIWLAYRDVGGGKWEIDRGQILYPIIQYLNASPEILWPPNHKMIPVEVNVKKSDCSPESVCRISSVTSNEPQNGVGDGNTGADWQITGDLTVNFRAERAGKGDGRIYTIYVTCTSISEAEYSTTKTVQVKVPHDKLR